VQEERLQFSTQLLFSKRNGSNLVHNFCSPRGMVPIYYTNCVLQGQSIQFTTQLLLCKSNGSNLVHNFCSPRGKVPIYYTTSVLQEEWSQFTTTSVLQEEWFQFATQLLFSKRNGSNLLHNFCSPRGMVPIYYTTSVI
jgi:hypothetical protein